jgi:aminoglycoside phosphotransferase family enzyme/predicted kinase
MLIDKLQDPAAYPHEVTRIRVIETHISWVLLTGRYAYKIKKPVDLGFLDFSTLPLRQHYCDEELRLNRRFAPDLYVDVVPIGGSVSAPRLGEAPALEWAVRMHEFPVEAGLDVELEQGRVEADQLRQLADRVADAHLAAPALADPRFASAEHIGKPARENFDSLMANCDSPLLRDQLASLCDWTEHALQELAPVFAERAGGGLTRECHGDLHAGNVVRLDAGLVPFDCIEFSDDLRCIDVISDIAFLYMDLVYRRRPDLAAAFLTRYLECTGDYAGLSVLGFYLVYRAVVRAKVAGVRYRQHGDPADAASIADHLALALRIAERSERPLLVICQGLSGSGKTWLSDKLIAALPALRLRSDVLRKQQAGLAEFERSGSGLNEGLYAPASSEAVYRQLAEFARLGLSAGLNVIVDATCLRRSQRDALRATAQTAGAGFVIAHCDASRETLKRRIRERSATGSDASEADDKVLESQIAGQDPLADEELGYSVTVNTAALQDIAELAATLRHRAAATTRFAK